MKKYVILLLILLILPLYQAECSEDQIDINNADKTDLINIKYIGDVRAEELIELRPFESLDDLIRIKGIGETYLQRIKEEDLACVGEFEEEEKKEETIDEEHERVKETDKTEEVKEETTEEANSQKPKKIEPEIIKLNPEVIKTQESEVKSDNGKNLESFLEKYAIQGFVIFSAIIILLFIIKDRKYKNEFK